MKGKILAVFLIVFLLCGCGEKTTLTLESTVWNYSDTASVEFYSDSTGKIVIDELSLPFRYIVNDDKINITCTDPETAELYGLDVLPFFGANSFSLTEAELIIGDWILQKTE